MLLINSLAIRVKHGNAVYQTRIVLVLGPLKELEVVLKEGEQRHFLGLLLVRSNSLSVTVLYQFPTTAYRSSIILIGFNRSIASCKFFMAVGRSSYSKALIANLACFPAAEIDFLSSSE